MGLKNNETIIILLIGIGAACLLAAVFLFRIWQFYIRNTKNKAMYLRSIRRNATTAPANTPDTTAVTTPPQKDPEAGETV